MAWFGILASNARKAEPSQQLVIYLPSTNMPGIVQTDQPLSFYFFAYSAFLKRDSQLPFLRLMLAAGRIDSLPVSMK
jgi:hypothetical protein